MRHQKPLLLTWLLVLLIIAGITWLNRQESSAYYGIAESREIVVSSEHGVELKSIAIVPGQEVKEGDLLVSLSRPDLSLKINEIAHQIEEIKLQKVVKSGDLESQIQQIKGEQVAALSEIDFKIKQIQTQTALNQQLTSGLKSLQKNKKSIQLNNGKNPIQIQIDGLNQEKEMIRRMAQIKLTALNKALGSSGDPVKVQIESLEKELKLFKAEQDKLNTYATINGVIGSVNFKPGEKVSPFAPILTLHTRSPSSVMGYIHENVYHRVNVGDKVRVTSSTGTGSKIEGEVVGVGARIVPFPIRLQKRPDIQMWGREVQIQIPEANGLLLGEKVLIQSNRF